MIEPSDMTFATADPLTPPASDLLAAMVAEMLSLYELPHGTILGTPLSPAELAPPVGLYLVGWIASEPVAGGGLRALADGAIEIKRMYVRPEHRGRGVGSLLLGALEDAAHTLGYSTLRLDTGPRQPGARRLYEGAGYQSVPDYNHNPHATFWGEKVVPPSALQGGREG